MDQFARRSADLFGSLSPTRKVLLAATGGVAVALAVLLYSWSSQTSYATLYTGLDAADSGRIVEQLRAEGVAYELGADGATVRVPQQQVDELRLDFAAQGLPEGGKVGFELFDGNSFTATDFVQRLNFQRGLQGELARTIESFPAVEQARVHIVMPERSLFVEDERPSTASVVLQLQPGRALETSQVSGIAHLVSGAVEGLEKANITIVDSAGNMLYDGARVSENGGLGISTSQLETQRNFEQALEHDVQGLLDRALGSGRSAVQVRATLDFDQLETETEAWAPGGEEQAGVPRSTTTVEETYSTNGDATTGAIPGAVANIPGADAAIDGNAASETSATNYTRNEETSNYEVGRTVTRSVQAPGSVDRLSVSLLLDESVPQAQATSLSDAVAAAVGLDTDRGDRIVLSRLAFDRSASEAAEQAFAEEASGDQLLSYVRMGLPVVVLLLAFVFFKLLLRSAGKRGEYRAGEAPAGLLPGGASSADSALAALYGGQRLGALPEPPQPEELRSEIEHQVTKIARSRPDSVAEVVQAWMKE